MFCRLVCQGLSGISGNHTRGAAMHRTRSTVPRAAGLVKGASFNEGPAKIREGLTRDRTRLRNRGASHADRFEDLITRAVGRTGYLTGNLTDHMPEHMTDLSSRPRNGHVTTGYDDRPAPRDSEAGPARRGGAPRHMESSLPHIPAKSCGTGAERGKDQAATGTSSKAMCCTSS
jgi:hypothetical protein